MQKTIILFARLPRYGKGKTRLARTIGKLRAWRFYQRTLEVLSKKLININNIDFKISVTPNINTKEQAGKLLAPYTLMQQGNGDLGRRMKNAFLKIDKGKAVIIGSDIPDIEVHHIKQAFKKLETHDAVFGPCDDGGYWLVGLKNTCYLPRGFMENVRWSTSHSLQDTLSTLPKSWKVSYITQLDDIDTGAVYDRWRAKNKKGK